MFAELLRSGSIVMFLLKDPRPLPRGMHLFALSIQLGFSWFLRKKKMLFLTFDWWVLERIFFFSSFSVCVCWVTWSFCFSYSSCLSLSFDFGVSVCEFGLYLFVLVFSLALWRNQLRIMFSRHCSNYVIFNMVSIWDFRAEYVSDWAYIMFAILLWIYLCWTRLGVIYDSIDKTYSLYIYSGNIRQNNSSDYVFLSVHCMQR